jgi:hypothetical protein
MNVDSKTVFGDANMRGSFGLKKGLEKAYDVSTGAIAKDLRMIPKESSYVPTSYNKIPITATEGLGPRTRTGRGKAIL